VKIRRPVLSKNHGASNLPSRLIDVKERGHSASVLLVETRKNKACQNYQYATLSHCRGKTHVLQTTIESLAQRKRSIEWKLLPKTFQDAITIARALGIRFIWIDSQCVVQDNWLVWEDNLLGWPLSTPMVV
jgi:hypothetical protein